jgi:hypothetical protein
VVAVLSHNLPGWAEKFMKKTVSHTEVRTLTLQSPRPIASDLGIKLPD